MIDVDQFDGAIAAPVAAACAALIAAMATLIYAGIVSAWRNARLLSLT